MKLAIVVDGSRPDDLAHARVQAARLRRAGLGVVGLSQDLDRSQRDAVSLLYGVGAGAWRSARRLSRRVGVPVVYDHVPGTTPPRKLEKADAVVVAGNVEARALQSHLCDDSDHRLVVVPPEPPGCANGIRPRLRQRLGAEGRTVALQEAAGLSDHQADALIRAVSSLRHVDLVFLGGERWRCRADLAKVAEKAHVRGRVHFFGEVPSARRIEYLREADIGLALAGAGYPRGRLPAADVFDMLGIPFITGIRTFTPGCTNHVASGEEPAALSAAIEEAGGRERMPVREDGMQVLAELIVDISAPNGDGPRSMDSALPKPSRQPKEKTAHAADDEATASMLLNRAKALGNEGDREQALSLYERVASDSHPPEAMASAAVGLARLNARAEAQEAVDRVLSMTQRPPLATARLGEAVAVLGDLTQARACAGEVLADTSAPDPALRTVIRVLEQAGEPRAALRVARQVDDGVGVARIEGTLMSYDPSWLPGRNDVSEPLQPRAGQAFTLLETSLPYVRSGYTYRAQTLLRAQQRAGIEPTVLTRLGFPATRGLGSPSTDEIDGIVHHRVGMPGVKQYTSVPVSEQLEANVRWAAALAQEVQPEGIIATTPHLNGLVGLALRSKLRVPMVYDVRGFPEMTWAVRKGGGDTDAFGLRRVAETRCMREADLVITLSETMRRHIVSRGVPAEKVFVLPHAVDTVAFAPAERDHELAGALGLSGRTVVGYISSLVAYEGVDILLDAVALARRINPDLAGLVVGSGELLPSLEAQARKRGLDGHVVFTGRVDAGEIARYYSLTDIFVCPRQDYEVTRYVTPLKPFEAMAAGCCVVVSDLPTLREAVRDGVCGALFPAGDSAALSQTILSLVDQPERRQKLKTAARNHAVANHDFENLGAKFEQLWAELRLLTRARTSQNRTPQVFSP